MDLQDTVRKCTSPDDQEMIEEKREALVAMFAQLKELQNSAGIVENTSNQQPVLDEETEYDEPDESTMSNRESDLTPVERKIIVIPSNGNVINNAAELEMSFRTRQADSQLNQIRDVIADISFQYSHVIRGQIRKTIRTRSQKRIKSLHHKLSLHARIYTRCRNHLVALKCLPSILRQYRVLKKEDLKTSTAILNPNQPGSTSLKLSWIWHSGAWLIMNDNGISNPVPDAGADRNAGPFSSSSQNEDAGAGSDPDNDTGPDPFTLHECKYLINN